ncbi:hypothetical protein [Streptomyces corynorhini]|uniref:Uncharacterized protein n=1 Tax=Streptomyces corynorhini TaxID=2282652 RepID=A0A370BCW3_9ACTN|nr:hypothetical protein [Streptomyces corynorhini]RDG39590.1 hypothetical protein DVH02_02980 [Streptomyces corynorhini]
MLPLLLLSACGPGGKDGDAPGDGRTSAGDPADQPGTGDPGADVLRFVRCLRDNGLKVDDPEANGNVSIQVTESQDQAKIDKARNACKQFLDEGSGGSGGAAGGGKETEEHKVWRLKVESCMRDKGFEMSSIEESEKAAHEKASKECYAKAGPVPGEGQ